nr:MAG: hypothetical protein [Bacteriophage sp.]
MIRTKILIAALLLSSPVFATVNTLDLVDEYTNGSSKVCVYSDGHRTEIVTKDGAGSCPSKKTFH